MTFRHITGSTKSPPHIACYVKFSRAYALHTPGDHNIGIATLNCHRSQTNGIKATTATTINGKRRHLHQLASFKQ
jgi:hypothetical protein